MKIIMLEVNGFPYAFQTQKRHSPITKEQEYQRTVIVPGGGCTYYRGKKGDVCPFCAFPAFSREVNLGPGNENFFGKWTLDSQIYTQMYLQSMTDCADIGSIKIFNGGSYFPEAELPQDFQHFIYQDVAKRSHIKQLVVESHPSYIKQRKLDIAKEMLGNTDLMVAMGFESHHNVIRNTILKKGISLSLFEQKVRLLQRQGVQVFAYVFLKAPQLSEKQALDETLATLTYLHNLGVDEMALSCAFVPEGTELAKQYHLGTFRPPWLWSILEIIKVADKQGWPLSVGGFEDTPPPIAGPSNCVQCDPQINAIIDHHRLHGKISAAPDVTCDCHSKWSAEMANKTPFNRIL